MASSGKNVALPCSLSLSNLTAFLACPSVTVTISLTAPPSATSIAVSKPAGVEMSSPTTPRIPGKPLRKTYLTPRLSPSICSSLDFKARYRFSVRKSWACCLLRLSLCCFCSWRKSDMRTVSRRSSPSSAVRLIFSAAIFTSSSARPATYSAWLANSGSCSLVF